jgi:hypothetical protein
MKNLTATFVEAEAVALIEHWLKQAHELLAADAGFYVMRENTLQVLRHGSMEAILWVIDAARAGHPEADAALKARNAEMLDRGEMPGALIRAYLEEESIRPRTLSYGRGRNFINNSVRNVVIAMAVEATMKRWGLDAKRNKASVAKGILSASYLVNIALGRSRYASLTEWQVERIHANNHKAAHERVGRLYATNP